MKNKVRLLFFAILIAFTVAEELSIIELDIQNYQHVVSTNRYVMVQFYSPSNPVSQNFEPQYTIAAKTLVQLGFVVARVNQNKNIELSNKMGIKNVPSFLLYDEQKPLMFQGQGNARHLIEWTKLYLQNRIKPIKQEELETINVPYFCILTNEEKNLKLMNRLAFILRGVSVHHIQSAENRIFYHQKGTSEYYTEQIQHEKLKKWMKKVTAGPITHMTEEQEVQEIMMTETIPSLVLILTKQDTQNMQIQDMVSNLCEKNKQRIKCGKMFEGDAFYEGSHDFFRKNADQSIVSIVKNQLRVAYLFTQEFSSLTEIELTKWLQQVLSNKIDPLIDNRVPDKVKFKNVEIFTNQTIEKHAAEFNVTVIGFYHPDNQSSIEFALRFDSLAQILKNQDSTKQLGIAAIDCSASYDFCDQKLVVYYPTIRLYYHGVSIEFPQQSSLPEIPQIQNFINEKLARQPHIVKSQDQIPRPAVVVKGPSIVKEVSVFAKVYDKIETYFLKTQSESFSLELWTGDDIHSFEGNFDVPAIKKWVNGQTGPLLSDMLKEVPDDKIVSAIQNRKPLIFLLDVEKNKSQAIKKNFGKYCYQLKLACGYADPENEGYSFLLDWIRIEKPTKSTIIYTQTLTDKKYIYPGIPQELSQQSLKIFLEDIKNNKIEATENLQKKTKKKESDSKPQPTIEESDL